MSYLYFGDGKEETFLKSLNIISQDSVTVKKDTRNQIGCSLWFELRELRITFSTCHKIFICQRNFDTVHTEIINPCDFKDLPPKIKEALSHGKKLSWEHLTLY